MACTAAGLGGWQPAPIPAAKGTQDPSSPSVLHDSIRVGGQRDHGWRRSKTSCCSEKVWGGGPPEAAGLGGQPHHRQRECLPQRGETGAEERDPVRLPEESGSEDSFPITMLCGSLCAFEVKPESSIRESSTPTARSGGVLVPSC